MENKIQRATTRYVELEDRVLLSGALDHGAPALIWLSQRLLLRLLPVLLQWLEDKVVAVQGSEVLQEFAQQAARGQLEPQAAVLAQQDSHAWLAGVIDVRRGPASLTLVFRATDDQNSASLVLDVLALRQWLNILYDVFGLAGWTGEVWPDWLRGGVAVTAVAGVPLH